MKVRMSGYSVRHSWWTITLPSLTRGRQSIEEINHTGLQRVLGANHQEPGFLNELLDDIRAVPQILHRRADVGANRSTAQGMQIMLKIRRQQAFDGRPYQIDDGM